MNISITRVLAQLKSLDQRIAQGISSGPYMAVAKGTTSPTLVGSSGYKTKADLEEAIRTARQSLVKLIDNRNKLRSALTQSNATTLVEIDGVKRTVAEIIEYKRTFVPLMQNYIAVMKNQMLHFARVMDTENASLEAAVERQSVSLTQSSQSKQAPDANVLAGIRASLEVNLKPALVDPLSLRDVIEEEQKKLDNFITEVDYALSESNAKTVVDLELAG